MASTHSAHTLACLCDKPEDPDCPVWGQGLLFSTAELLKTPLDLVRLWLHEAERVYSDKMVDERDQDALRRVTMASTKKFFDVSQDAGSLCRSHRAPRGHQARARSGCHPLREACGQDGQMCLKSQTVTGSSHQGSRGEGIVFVS